MLWGAAMVRRPPGRAHPWHSDMETSGEVHRTVSAWIGLEHTTPLSSLHVVPYSHRFGRTIQEVAQAHGRMSGDVNDQDAQDWAQSIDPRTSLVRPEMGNGDAIWFDGRLWHGTRNLDHDGVRIALLLQYATPSTQIRIPERTVTEWPFRFLEEPRPPCIMVRGRDSSARNRFVPAPPPAGSAQPSTWVHTFRLPLAADPQGRWRRHPAFRGVTMATEELSCHASVLSPGATPHPLHDHPEEELLVVLSGELDVVLAPANQAADGSVRSLQPGSSCTTQPAAITVRASGSSSDWLGAAGRDATLIGRCPRSPRSSLP